MTELPNTTAEVLGTGGTVKFRSPCPVIVEQVGVGNVATLTGTDTFVATEAGEYLFENTCDCKGFYEVLDVGDMTDGCCVAPVVDAGGALTGITVAGIDYLINDADTTYTFPAIVGPDGVMTVTDSDGGSQTVTIEFPEDVDIASNSVVGGVVKFVDSNGDPLPGLDIDLNPYISDPHPVIAASGDATATFDAGTNTWTIGFVDTDTDTQGRIVEDGDGNQYFQTVDIDGNVIGTPTLLAGGDTDVSGVDLFWDVAKADLTVAVTENGNTVSSDTAIGFDNVNKCFDRVLTRDVDTGELVLKFVKPPAETKYEFLLVDEVNLMGAAVDAVVNQIVQQGSLTSTGFADNTACYTNDDITYGISAGGEYFNIRTAGDEWLTSHVTNHPAYRSPEVSHNLTASAPLKIGFGQMAATHSRSVSAGTAYTSTIAISFEPLTYTPNAQNQLNLAPMVLSMKRQQITAGT